MLHNTFCPGCSVLRKTCNIVLPGTSKASWSAMPRYQAALRSLHLFVESSSS